VDETDTRRSSDELRDDILLVVQRLLAWMPYSDVGIRGVAREAGVSPALVMKYFGSKERLVAEALDFREVFDALLEGPLPDLGHALVERLARIAPPPKGADPLGVLVFVAGSRGLPAELRSAVLEQFVQRLAARLDGADRRARAEIACAHLLGISLMRRTVGAPELSSYEPDALSRIVGPTIQRLIDAPRLDSPER
jgi:AcrR family transcriptional regulator